MPQISKTQIDLLTAYLLEDNSTNVEVASLQEIDPNFSPYSVNYFGRFMDENGYPAIKPPWGTLNAIDLNIPFKIVLTKSDKLKNKDKQQLVKSF